MWQRPLEGREGTDNLDQRWRWEGKDRSVKWATPCNPEVFSFCGCMTAKHLLDEFTTRKGEKLRVALLRHLERNGQRDSLGVAAGRNGSCSEHTK